MLRAAIRVLGVDTALRKSGIAVVEECGTEVQSLEYAVIRCAASWRVSRCLLTLQEQVEDRIVRFHPDAIALEGVFFCRNALTALRLGEARGVVLAAAARRSVPVFEYEPKTVKKAVVGWGAADKSQVVQMIRMRLSLKEDPPEDAADALAIAICHLQRRSTCSVTGETGEI